MNVRFEVNPKPLPAGKTVLSLLESAEMSFPIWSEERLDRALKSSSLVICAYSEMNLIGFARVITDFAWVAWLSQLVVSPEFQKQGLGKKLLKKVLENLGDEVTLLTHSAERAAGFYEKMGLKPYSNVYRLDRKK